MAAALGLHTELRLQSRVAPLHFDTLQASYRFLRLALSKSDSPSKNRATVKRQTISRKALGISPEFSDWTSDPAHKMRGIPRSARYLDAIDVAWGARLMSFPRGTPRATLLADYWVNPSQGIQRKTFGGPGTLTTSGFWYNFQHDTCLDAYDMMRIHGFPSLVDCSGLSQHEARDLGGEAFCLPIVTAIIASLYFCPFCDWWFPSQ